MTTSAPVASSAPPKAGRHQRNLRNYLIDSSFQLKYTGFIIAVALVISAILGVFLLSTSHKVVEQSDHVLVESKKVSDVVKMTIRDNYADNPELANAFNGEAVLNEQKLAEQRQSLVQKQKIMFAALVGGLTLMVILIGLLGIYFTHKVAGPIYKMTMLLRQVGEGKLSFHGRLRRGDELQDFFQTFLDMVQSLKARQFREYQLLEAAIEKAKAAGVGEDALHDVVVVKEEIKASLDIKGDFSTPAL
ncbi:hypothetical protein LVJ94_35650 [Pendulispora rubella]|uniref:HAMP domain-containing protein n=1 Tax=Pendulispora rubella TaxID=2741070 RepID=A0ABZ2KU71_9BACT